MLDRKNHLMLWLSGAAVLLNVVIFVLNRTWNVFQSHHHGAAAADITDFTIWGQNVLLAVPLLLYAMAGYMYRKNKLDQKLPLFIVLTLTFSSISIISGSGGGVEFHFSIFMVVAVAAYYENIKLISVMTGLFAVQHLAGFFWFPQLVFGTDHYSFLMLLVHAGFLVLTSGATMLQIQSKRTIMTQLEAEKNEKDRRLLSLVQQVRMLSDRISAASEIVAGKSEMNVRINQEMRKAFGEMIEGFRDQGMSLEQVEHQLRNIHEAIRETTASSDVMKEDAVTTNEEVTAHYQSIVELQAHNGEVLQSILHTSEMMEVLKQASAEAQGKAGMVREVSDQTRLLSLNASIEAARAEGGGQGFAVIAGEIRKLAEASHATSEQIQSMIREIHQRSEQNAERMSSGKEACERTVAMMDSFAAKFDKMRRLIEQLLAYITNTNLQMASLQREAAGVTNNMEHIFTVVSNSMSSMERVNQLTDRLIDSAEQVKSEVAQLGRLSQSLQDQFVNEADVVEDQTAR